MMLIFRDTEDVNRALKAPETAALLRSDDRLRWYCSADGVNVLSGFGTPSLIPGAIILSDMNWQDYKALTGQKEGLRYDSFLRLTVSDILEDWNLQNVEEVPRDEACRILADVFARATRIMTGIINHMLPEGSGDWHPFSETSFGAIIARLIERRGFVGIDPNFRSELGKALGNVMQTGARPRMPSGLRMGGTNIKFRAPALDWLQDMLKFQVPAGDWRRVDPVPVNIVELLEKENLPAIFKIRFTGDISNETLRLLGWSTQNNAPRNWATMDELKLIQSLTDVEISQVLVCDGWIDHKLSEALAGDLGRYHNLQYFSWTVDLVAQNILSGLMRVQKGRAPTPLAIWISAADRLKGLKTALRFNEAGFAVVRFYAGEIEVIVPDDRKLEAMHLAANCGFLPSLNLSMTNPVHDIEWGGLPAMETFAEQKFAGLRELIWQLDGCIDLPENQINAGINLLLSDSET